MHSGERAASPLHRKTCEVIYAQRGPRTRREAAVATPAADGMSLRACACDSRHSWSHAVKMPMSECMASPDTLLSRPHAHAVGVRVPAIRAKIHIVLPYELRYGPKATEALALPWCFLHCCQQLSQLRELAHVLLSMRQVGARACPAPGSEFVRV